MKLDIFCFLPVTIVFLYITVKFRTHYPTKYTKYQQYLFDIIKGYREQSVSEWTWKKIVDILNSKNLKTPMGKTFKSNNVYSIYKKGKIREKRLNSKYEIVDRKLEIRRYTKDGVYII